MEFTANVGAAWIDSILYRADLVIHRLCDKLPIRAVESDNRTRNTVGSTVGLTIGSCVYSALTIVKPNFTACELNVCYQKLYYRDLKKKQNLTEIVKLCCQNRRLTFSHANEIN